MNDDSKRLFLIDAYALIFRSYYAFIGRPMRNREGLNTSAIFGFTKFLRDIIKREHPHYLGVAFDPPGGNFRHDLYPEYKANRSATPEDIIASVPYIKEIVQALRIPILEVAGYEADDVIGTLSGKASAAGYTVYMVTPDKDYGQLVRPTVYIYKQGKGGEGVEIIGCDQIREHYGVDDPRLIIDILALWGDASDNIPGVPGIGEKGAVKLVSRFGTVEEILAHADEIGGRQRENLLATAEQLALSKRLATIEMDVPIDFNPEALVMEDPDCDRLKEVFRQLGFNMFIREVEAGLFIPACSASSMEEGSSGNLSEGAVAELKAAAPAPTTGSRKVARAAQTSLSGQGDLFAGAGDEVSEAVAAENPQGDLFAVSQYATVADTPHDYRIIRSEEDLSSVVARLRACGEFCFDTETTGFDVFGDRIVGMSFSVKAHEAWYLPCGPDNTAAYAALLKPLFEDEAIAKIGQNIKFDIMVLDRLGIRVRGFKYDTMLLHYLLDPESRHNMNFLARTYLNYSPVEIETLIGRGAKQLTMDRVAVETVAEYAAEDADVTFQLKEVLWPKVVEQGFETLYRQIEEPLIDVLADIELAGVRIDCDILSDYGRRLNEELSGIEERIRELAGEPTLNINSARQLGEVLFTKLNIDPKPKLTKTKQYRTDEEYLQMLSDRHPIIGLILDYRGVKKLLSTYVEALPQLVNPKTGRVHASFNQAVTATGRLSSTNPNLQNIPVRDERGREIRKAFVPADDDHLLLSADYSQVELRLMAHLSGDPALIEAFRHGEDIHAATAARLFGVSLSEVTSEQRRRAKTANFGIIYGISAFGLAQRLNIPRTEAKEIIDGYFASYKGVKEYMDRVIAQAREDGYVSTIFGRKRYLSDIRSHNAVARGLAERNAINAPIQGSAADIMKLAMIAVHREFERLGLRSKVILQVHDELVIDMYKPEREEVIRIVVDAMEHAADLKVSLTVDFGEGNNWLEAH